MAGVKAIDGIDLSSFAPGATNKTLHNTRCSGVPTVAGVYVVVRTGTAAPTVHLESQAG